MCDDADKLIKEHFYEQLSYTLASIEGNKDIFILGDLNGPT